MIHTRFLVDVQKLPHNVVSVAFDKSQNVRYVSKSPRSGWYVGDDSIAGMVEVPLSPSSTAKL